MPLTNFPNLSSLNLPKMDPLPAMHLMPNLELPVLKDIKFKDPHWASEYHKRLREYIIDFEKSLTDHEELAIKLVSFGESVTVIVERIGYYNPGLISFYGTSTNGQRVQLIQHVRQLSFLLIATKTEKPIEKRNRIGFRLKKEIEKEEEQQKNPA